MLKPKTGEDDNKENELVSTGEPRTFYTLIKSVRINSTQNEDINVSRNMVTGVLNDSTNKMEKTQLRWPSQPTSKERHTVTRIRVEQGIDPVSKVVQK